MGGTLTRTQIGEKIHFNHVIDSKFKHNRLSVNFVMPLERETASDNAVVPFILRKGCRECPDFTSLNARLADLYGASLDADVSKYSGYQVLEISIRGLDDRFALDNEDITRECASLLASVVLDPKLDENGLFFEPDVASERQYVIDTIESLINEKRGYAISQCMQLMCEGEPVAVRRYGYIENAGKITPESASNAYRRMLGTAPVEIMFTGSGEPASAEKIFRERFAGLKRDSFDYELAKLRTTAEKVREHTETMELSQSKLVMGMRCGDIKTREQITAARVFAAMFGGTPFSKLFANVREKLSLCYYCAARFDVATRLLLVDSGVEAENKQKAQDEILVQLEALKNGDFTDEELANTKLLLNNSIRTTSDSLSSIEGWYITQILRGQSVTPEEDVLNINTVTREQIIAAAKQITLDTVYFLTGSGKDEN